MPWQPGQSGNPNGNAGPKRFAQALERALAQDDGKKLRAAIDSMLDAAAKGEPWAIQFLADRLDGKAAQTVQLIRDASELSDNDLLNIASTGSDRASKETGGEEKPSKLH